MRTKDQGIIADIEKYVCEFNDRYGYSPTLQEIADGVGISKATASRYVNKMCEDGIFDTAGRRSITSAKTKVQSIRVPVLGAIACGIPKFAEENIEEYVKLDGMEMPCPKCGSPLKITIAEDKKVSVELLKDEKSNKS